MGGMKAMTSECWSCDGSGELDASGDQCVDCHVCGGSGWIVDGDADVARGTLYIVDWRDLKFPKIVPCSGGKSFTECQLEIITTAEDFAGHWKSIINTTRAMREPGKEGK